MLDKCNICHLVCRPGRSGNVNQRLTVNFYCMPEPIEWDSYWTTSRSWAGVHSIPPCSVHDACTSALGRLLLHYDHLPGFGQWGKIFEPSIHLTCTTYLWKCNPSWLSLDFSLLTKSLWWLRYPTCIPQSSELVFGVNSFCSPSVLEASSLVFWWSQMWGTFFLNTYFF